MPTLLLKVTPLQNPERYQALAAALTIRRIRRHIGEKAE